MEQYISLISEHVYKVLCQMLGEQITQNFKNTASVYDNFISYFLNVKVVMLILLVFIPIKLCFLYIIYISTVPSIFNSLSCLPLPQPLLAYQICNNWRREKIMNFI